LSTTRWRVCAEVVVAAANMRLNEAKNRQTFLIGIERSFQFVPNKSGELIYRFIFYFVCLLKRDFQSGRDFRVAVIEKLLKKDGFQKI
jgi:hypothetical protein